MRLFLAFVLSVALVAPARAGSAADEERARGHYEIALGLYRLGDYEGALKEFAAGYELARKPGFLLNLGQTYRKLGELREARDMYRQFLAAVRSDDPARPEARKVLAEIEQALRKPPAPEPRKPPAPEPRSPPAPEPRSAAASEPRSSPSPPEPRSAAAPGPRRSPSPSEPRSAAAPEPRSAPAPEPRSPPAPEPRSAPPAATEAPAGSEEAAPAPAEATPSSARPPAGPSVAPPPPSSAAVQASAAAPRRRRGLRIAGIGVGALGLALLGGGVGASVAANGVAGDLNATDRAGGVFDPAQDRAYGFDRALAAGLFVSGAVLAATGAVLLVVSAR